MAPSAPAAAAQREAVVRRGHALIGTHFVTVPALARLLLERLGQPAPRRRPDPLELRERLRLLVADRNDPVSRYARRFSGAMRGLLAAVVEWQTAGRPTADGTAPDRTAAGAPVEDRARQVIEVARAFEARTRDLATRHELVRRAVEALRATAAARTGTVARVLIAGFAELPGDLRQLSDALRGTGVAVRGLPQARHRPERVARFNAPDPHGELRLAAARCVDLASDGVPWHEMVLACPRLGVYLPHVARAFEAEGVPFRATGDSPLAREPRGALSLHAARLLFDEAPRVSMMALLSSPLLRDRPTPLQLRVFDELSRREHVLGAAAINRSFLELLRRRLDDLAVKRPIVVDLCEQWAQIAAGHPERVRASEHARALARFAESYFHTPRPGTRDADAARLVSDCVDALSSGYADAPIEAGEFVRELVQLSFDRGLPLQSPGRPSAVHVTTLEDAIAMPATHLHVLGLDHQSLPRGGPPQTFFADVARASLGMRDTEAERALQLRVVELSCHHPTSSLCLSRPRAREGGRPVGPSTWLPRVVAEAGAGSEEIRSPAHPLARGQQRIRTGRCPRDLGLTCLALAGAPVEHLEALCTSARRPWSQARRLERFDASDLHRDGDLGGDRGVAIAQASLSVTELHRLGRCPHQHLFRDVFKCRPLPAEPDPVELPRDRLGDLVHEVLEGVYSEFGERLRRMPEPSAIAGAMAERARQLFETGLEQHGGPLRRDFPSLHSVLETRWFAALDRHIRGDLVRMERDGSRPLRVESAVERVLQVRRPDAAPVDLQVHGRIDRIDRRPDGALRVLDVKTGGGGNPHSYVEPLRILRGQRLQLPIYALLCDAPDDRVEEIAVHVVRPGAGEPPGAGGPGSEAVIPLADARSYLDGARRMALDETLAVLAELRASGALLQQTDDPPCGFCPFRAACRRLHPPSVERSRAAGIAAYQRYRMLSTKTTAKPVLFATESDVR